MESSVIFQGISDKEGIVSLLVKGYKRPKSKIRGEIDVLTVSEVLFYPGDTREIYPVKEAKMKQSFPEIYKNYAAMKRCLEIGRIILKTTPKDLSGSVFLLYRGLLQEVNRKNGVCENSLYFGMFAKLLHLNGVFPKLNQCVKCGSPAVKYISLKAGGPLCEKCARKEQDSITFSPGMARELFFFLTRDFSEISRFKGTRETYELLKDIVEMHLEGENKDEAKKGSL